MDFMIYIRLFSLYVRTVLISSLDNMDFLGSEQALEICTSNLWKFSHATTHLSSRASPLLADTGVTTKQG